MSTGIDYQEVLKDLTRRRDETLASLKEFAAAISAITKIAGNSEVADAARPAPVVMEEKQPSAFEGMTTFQAAVEFLRDKKKPQTTSEISKALENGGFKHKSKNFYSTVRNALLRAVKRNEVVRTSRGWKLPPNQEETGST